MDESYGTLPASSFLGSVPAAVNEERKTTTQGVPSANLQIFPPSNAGSGGQGYQPISSSNGGGEQQQQQQQQQQEANNWNGVFSISSYTQYFNVDTDIVLNRLLSTFNPTSGDFVHKIDANPDLYGLVWISTTLVFVLASLGNCATYLMNQRSGQSSSWNYDVSYTNMAAGSIYGYALIVPLGYYFLLRYMDSNASLVRFWCLWGYSLFAFIPTSFLLVIPVEFLRWSLIVIAGAASSSFVGTNLKSYVQTDDLMVVVVSAIVLQIGLAIFIKMWFFA